MYTYIYIRTIGNTDVDWSLFHCVYLNDSLAHKLKQLFSHK